MFEKSLTDLIRGIRANKKNEQKYIAVCLQEIRNEVKSNDIDIKAMAVAKLTYVRRQQPAIVLCMCLQHEPYCSVLAPNARLRHVMGVFSRCRSDVESKVIT